MATEKTHRKVLSLALLGELTEDCSWETVLSDFSGELQRGRGGARSSGEKKS